MLIFFHEHFLLIPPFTSIFKDRDILTNQIFIPRVENSLCGITVQALGKCRHSEWNADTPFATAVIQ